jgi:hypothetical protein
MRGKSETCKCCGGARDPALANRLCRPCYNAYVLSLRADPYSVVPVAERGDWESRLRVFRAVFARHGLREGAVWQQVKGARRELHA